MKSSDVDAWLGRQAARSPLATGLLLGLISGGLMLAAQLGNRNPQPLWAVPFFLTWFVVGLLLGRRERRRRWQ